MKSLWRDLSFGARLLLRSPGLSAVAILSLALAIGVNTVVFTFVNALLLRPLPQAQDPDHLVRLMTLEDRDGSLHGLSLLNYQDLERSNPVFSGLMAYTNFKVSLSSGDRAELENAEIVSGNYFRVLGIQPAAGRTFAPGEGEVPGRDPVIVLGHSLWERRFGADPGLIGRTIMVNGHRLTVIGVAPKGFTGIALQSPAQAWVLLSMHQQLLGSSITELLDDRNSRVIQAVGRIKDGVNLAAAGTKAGGLYTTLGRTYPEATKGHTLTLIPLEESAIGPKQRHKYVLGGIFLLVVTGLILLIACANLANLLLARAATRYKEIAIRLSVGAGRSQLVRMLLAESLLLALAGGVAGLLLTFWPRNLLWALRPPELAESLDIGVDFKILGFALLLSLVTGLLFGLAPVLRLSKPSLVLSLKSDAGMTAQSRVRPASLLVIAEVALTLVPVVGSGLFLRSLANAENFDPGFDVEHQVVLGLDLGTLGYDEARGQEFYRAAQEKLEHLPGVVSAGVAETLVLYPAAMGAWSKVVTLEGKTTSTGEKEEHLIQVNTVSPSYFQTLGIPLRAGRLFDANDRPMSPAVAIINETMAQQLWPGESALGKRFTFQDEGLREVVGVVRDIKYGTLSEDPRPYIYTPLSQGYAAPAFLHVRTRDPHPEKLLPLIRSEVQAMDPNLGLGFVMPMSAVFERTLWAPRLGAVLLLVFAALALVLAVLGIYGVITSAVHQRRREISIRLAIGAQRREVLGLLLREGMTLVGAGLGLGLVLSLLLGRSVSAFLFGLKGTDLGALALALAILAGAGLVANLLAARRAMAVEPMEVLRTGV